jgi:hypothetical protein
MTLEALRAFGANTDEGLERCLYDVPFYLDMVAMTLADGNFDALKAAMEVGDAHAAFTAAHALKGVVGNMALTPIAEPLCALTELLRGRDSLAAGGDALLEQVLRARETALRL